MQPRLKRYKNFIEKQYTEDLLKYDEYSLEKLGKKIKTKISSGKYKKILFKGMGCSAIVSDIIKGFFAVEKIPVHIDVINDYDIDYLLNIEDIKQTLVIISSYSGFSQEPINAYHKIKKHTKDIIFLTSGGKLEKIAKKENVSLIYWKIKNQDREYPLFHAPQYFSILLDIFYKLGLLKTNYQTKILKAKKTQNKNITVHVTKIDQSNFFKKFFSTLQLVQYVSYFLGIYYNYKSRELISTAAGNPWYNQKTIMKEKNKTKN
ncbi:MAG: hypothetical protein ACMXX7_02335 [Candidatus Woesearchaeota archaeon]